MADLKRPARQVCPLCALDDADVVSWAAEAPGIWRFTCTNHAPSYSWLTTPSSRIDEREGEGIAAELGVYESLRALFAAPGPFLEWGVVEYGFAQHSPDAY